METDLGRLVDALPALVWTATCDGAAEIVGRSWLEYTGLTASDVAGAGWQSAVHPDDIERLLSNWIAILKSEQPGEAEARLRRFDGAYRWFLFRATPVRDPSGAIVRWCGINVDIDDRKRVLADLLVRDSHYGAIADSIPSMISFMTPIGEIEMINRHLSEYIGETLETMPGAAVTKVVHPDDLERVVAAWMQAVQTGEPYDIEHRIRRADGVFRWFHTHALPLRDSEGRIARWYCLQTDVNERIRAETLLEAEKRLLALVARGESLPVVLKKLCLEVEALLEGSLCSVLLVDGDGARVGAGPALMPEHEPRSCWSTPILCAGGDLHGTLAIYRRETGMPASSEQEMINRFTIIAGIAIERSRRDRALESREAELRRAHAHLSEAQRLSKTGSFTTDLKDEHIWSDEMYRICDLEIGTNGARFMELVHPEDIQTVQAGIEDLIRGTVRSLTYRITTPKGVLKHLRTVGTVVDETEGRFLITGAIQDITESKLAEEALRINEAKLRKALTDLTEAQRLSKTGSFSADLSRDEHDWSDELYRIFGFTPGSRITAQRVRERVVAEDLPAYEVGIRPRPEAKYTDFEFRIAATDGAVKHLRAVAHRSEHITDRLVFVGAIQDVTETKVAEEAANKARAELAHVTRVMTLNALTASIAHEVNQPLAGIITNASTNLRMLSADSPNIEGARTTARRIIRDANRASEVIARLRSLFARKQPRREPVDLNEVAREVLALLSSELQRRHVSVRADLADGLPTLLGDRVQLQQVVLNLVINAADAMSGVEDRPRELLITTARDQIGQVLLSVRDSGVGIDPQNAKKLFEAFYTTKANGMGIGLSISRSIVEGHNGRLWAFANEGPGATFALSLPAIAETDAARKCGNVPSAELEIRNV